MRPDEPIPRGFPARTTSRFLYVGLEAAFVSDRIFAVCVQATKRGTRSAASAVARKVRIHVERPALQTAG